jgi:LIVCS family branched-chain amino acid:cation transporter
MNQLTRAQYFFIGSMLFGMLFGAGNLIFPVHMGQMAGSQFWAANWGFISTGVFMPVIALIALGISGAENVHDLANRVHPLYSRVFVLMLYLTIGPCFALPRTASVSFQVGVVPFVSPENQSVAMAVFTGIFMLVALIMGLKPSKLVVYIGKFLNPAFLLFLAVLVLVALIHPMGDFTSFVPQGSYTIQPYLTGFKEGYNTMDVLAVLAFAIVVIQTIQQFGVPDRVKMAKDIFKVGLIVMTLMTIIYTAITWLGASSMGKLSLSANGGIALAEIAYYYFGPLGLFLQAVIVTLACLKTAIGLITSCSEAFVEVLPNSLDYRKYCYIMAGFSFIVANVGLTQIIALAIPVLMFTYPLAIVLVISTYVAYFFQHDRRLYQWPAALTTLAAIGDAVSVLPDDIKGNGICVSILKFHDMLPFSGDGMAWMVPALLGILAALVHIKTTGVRPL